MKKTVIVLLILFGVGVAGGLFIGSVPVIASPLTNEVSGGEQPASVWYDEQWKAIGAIATTNGGYAHVNLPGKISNAAKMSKHGTRWAVSAQPKMVVTKWQVHGHIHFE
ncbi:MAG: hypothetical protein WCS77_05350 [Elusimicrobiaceae bacterium]|jgi:hypothetical protein